MQSEESVAKPGEPIKILENLNHRSAQIAAAKKQILQQEDEEEAAAENDDEDDDDENGEGREERKKNIDIEQSSDYSNGLIGLGSLVDDLQNDFKFSNRYLRARDFKPNYSLQKHVEKLK